MDILAFGPGWRICPFYRYFSHRPGRNSQRNDEQTGEPGRYNKEQSGLDVGRDQKKSQRQKRQHERLDIFNALIHEAA
jgi:hypothetical protein